MCSCNDLLLLMLLSDKCGGCGQGTYTNCDCLWQILLWLMLSGNNCSNNCTNNNGCYNGCGCH